MVPTESGSLLWEESPVPNGEDPKVITAFNRQDLNNMVYLAQPNANETVLEVFGPKCESRAGSGVRRF